MRIDLNDSGPLYRQIAARIAYCIATGRLPAGSRLPSLRKAQHAWGVHLHTVRRAYRELQSRGLVHIQVRGETVVLSGSTRPPATLRELVAAVLHEAEGAFGATAGTVTEEIRAIVQDHPQICVVECSRTLSSGLADQIARAWHVRAAPRLLEEEWPRGQAVISTYFHVRELRARLGERSSRITYLHIRLSTRVLQRIVTRVRNQLAPSVALCETDASLAYDIVGELRTGLGPRVRISAHTARNLSRFLDCSDRDAVKLVSPQNWDRLSEERRADPNVILLEYEVDPADLNELGRRLGWRPVHRRGTSNR